MTGELFVPADFAVPDGLVADKGFRLAPLGPKHNEADYAAWTDSIDHIRATPGFIGRSWPHPMSLEDNLRDLEQPLDRVRSPRLNCDSATWLRGSSLWARA